jgi:hypothetical protein
MESSNFGYDNTDYHEMNVKSIGIDLESLKDDDCGILPFFKKEFMPLIKDLREKIVLYDKFKGRALDVVKLLEDVLKCCLEFSLKHPMIREYLKCNGWLDE